MEVVEKVTCWLKRTYPKGASASLFMWSDTQWIVPGKLHKFSICLDLFRIGGAVPHLAYHDSTGVLLWDFSTGVQYGALQDPLSKQIGNFCSMFRKIH
jgi:hypothetical protein